MRTVPSPVPTDRLTVLLPPRHLDWLLQLRRSLPGDTGWRAEDLAEAWRAALPRWEALATEEAGAADGATWAPLPAEAQAHLDRLAQDPGVNLTFDKVPVAFGLARIDQLVLSQHRLRESTLAELVPPGAPVPDLAAQLDVCLPLPQDRPEPRLRVVHADGRDTVLVADSHDVRLLDTRVLSGAERPGVAVAGQLDTVVGALLGPSVNLVNLIAHAGRLVLNNGHHRVEALRRQGLSHVPCLIQLCRTAQEVQWVGSAELREQFELYFHAPRPPMLRDFGTPGLSCQLAMPRMRKEIRVRIEVESRMVAF